MYIKDEIVISSYWINTTHQRKVILMNNITGDLYRIEGIITSIFFDPWSNVFYLYINLLETQLRTSLGIIGDLLLNLYKFIWITLLQGALASVGAKAWQPALPLESSSSSKNWILVSSHSHRCSYGCWALNLVKAWPLASPILILYYILITG